MPSQRKKVAVKPAPAVLTVVVDAAGKPLGRLASEVAHQLRGKRQVGFVPNVLPTHWVVVKNTDQTVLTGRKRLMKHYWRYTGYPGGLRLTPVKTVLAKDSRLMVRRAVSGMLARNRLRAKLLKNLILHKSENG